MDNEKDLPKRKKAVGKMIIIAPAVRILLQYIRWKGKFIFGNL